MTMLDVKIRWEQQHDAMPELRLYALLDGAQYQTQHNKRLLAGTGLFPLFKGTPDAGLSHAGPWLVDVASVAESFVEELTALERDTPSLSWLISPQDLDGLAQLLQLRLEVRLPDGRSALLRFWDPRVLANLAQTLDAGQREEFFSHIYEWHLLHNGQRVWIGRHHADAQ